MREGENESPVNFSILIHGSDEWSGWNRSSSGCLGAAYMQAESDLRLTLALHFPATQTVTVPPYIHSSRWWVHSSAFNWRTFLQRVCVNPLCFRMCRLDHRRNLVWVMIDRWSHPLLIPLIDAHTGHEYHSTLPHTSSMCCMTQTTVTERHGRYVSSDATALNLEGPFPWPSSELAFHDLEIQNPCIITTNI